MNQSWKKYLPYALYILVGLSLVYGLIQVILIGYSASWTGFTTKTLWDWMDLLIIPLVLAGGAFYLNRSERAVEREIATDRQQEAALQAYLDRMAELLLDENLQTTKKKSVRNLAIVRTQTVLRGLDPKRKRIVFLFLWAAGLIDKGKPIVSLVGADFGCADLRGVQLVKPIFGSEIDSPTFQGADLVGAELTNADLSGADLREINLSHAILMSANLSHAKLPDAILRRTILLHAKLPSADMSGADLRGAFLSEADLTDANLFAANLAGANVTVKQLAKVKELEGAIMPDDYNYR